MAKNLMINKFYLRFNGVRYGKGDIVQNVPDNIAAKLIAENKGAITPIEIEIGGIAEIVDQPHGLEGFPGINPQETISGTKKKTS